MALNSPPVTSPLVALASPSPRLVSPPPLTSPHLTPAAAAAHLASRIRPIRAEFISQLNNRPSPILL
ncbi:unnamed protein product [Merluccius merluccius]